MSRAIIIQRIARRTGKKGVPRTIRSEGTRRLGLGERASVVAREVLVIVKRKTGRDRNARQVELVTVARLKGGRHKITSQVLFRVYRSESDKRVHVYAGAAHQGAREGVEAREIR